MHLQDSTSVRPVDLVGVPWHIRVTCPLVGEEVMVLCLVKYIDDQKAQSKHLDTAICYTVGVQVNSKRQTLHCSIAEK